MNAEIIKAISEKNKKHPIRKWWNENGYKVIRVVLFPIWIGMIIKKQINKYLNSRQEWSEERANEILSYYIPRVAEWDAEAKEFYFVDNGIGWGMKCRQRKLKLRDRRWWNQHRGPWGGKIRDYLLKKFELEGFEKIVGVTYDNWAEVTFRLIEK